MILKGKKQTDVNHIRDDSQCILNALPIQKKKHDGMDTQEIIAYFNMKRTVR